MRTIKFRGKRIDTDEWTIGSLVETNCGHVGIADLTRYSNEKIDCIIGEVDPKTVGQFTGLKDKNGNDIYEGDILKITQVRPKIEPHKDLGTCEVKFSIWYGWNVGTQFDRYAFDPSNPIDIIEIIGNIHDNPELLKGGTK